MPTLTQKILQLFNKSSYLNTWRTVTFIVSLVITLPLIVLPIILLLQHMLPFIINPLSAYTNIIWVPKPIPLEAGPHAVILITVSLALYVIFSVILWGLALSITIGKHFYERIRCHADSSKHVSSEQRLS
jgi:lysylphosphatidylglycerol synthetase-like protein (DUF2156 family)